MDHLLGHVAQVLATLWFLAVLEPSAWVSGLVWLVILAWQGMHACWECELASEMCVVEV